MKNVLKVFVAVCFLFSVAAMPAVAGNVVKLQKGEPVHLAYFYLFMSNRMPYGG